MKTYVVTVLKNSGNEVKRVKGREGLKALLAELGLSYNGLQELYAEDGVEAQVKMEWSE